MFMFEASCAFLLQLAEKKSQFHLHQIDKMIYR